MATSLTGLHIVRKRLKSGDRFYVYAWRSGPLIHTQDGTRPAITSELTDKATDARRRHGPKDDIEALVDLYRESPAYLNLAPATQTDYRLWLDRISHRFGRVKLHMVMPELRPHILLWRDELADTPRAADRGVKMLGTLFAWALERGLVNDNPARGVRSLHKVNRADLIWEARHWKAVEGLPEPILKVLRLASLTGLRQGDLLRLTWEQVGKHDIETTAQKTRSRVVIPLYPELRAELGRKGKQTGVILKSVTDQPWTPSGFRTAWQRNRPKGFDRTFHDLRGTFVTTLAAKGMPDQDIAYIVGWTTDQVAAIRRRYVDRARVAKRIAKRMKG